MPDMLEKHSYLGWMIFLGSLHQSQVPKGIIMKAFILCISIVFGIFAIAVYVYIFKHRIKESTDKSGQKR